MTTLRDARLRALCCPNGCIYEGVGVGGKTTADCAIVRDKYSAARFHEQLAAHDVALEAHGYMIVPKKWPEQVDAPKNWYDHDATWRDVWDGACLTLAVASKVKP